MCASNATCAAPRDAEKGRSASGQSTLKKHQLTDHKIHSFTALAHRSWILEEALPRKRGRLD